jgi:peptidoglycan hydrolase-like protein with peptidoglycan-binding domain
MSAAQPSRNTIKSAQAKLREQHLYGGRIDGILGPRTKTALLQFQRKKGLPATGKLDRQTLASLGGRMTSGQGSGMPSNGGPGTPAGQGQNSSRSHSY